TTCTTCWRTSRPYGRCRHETNTRCESCCRTVAGILEPRYRPGTRPREPLEASRRQLADLPRRLLRSAPQPAETDYASERSPAHARLGVPDWPDRRAQVNADPREWRPVYHHAGQRLGA